MSLYWLRFDEKRKRKKKRHRVWSLPKLFEFSLTLRYVWQHVRGALNWKPSLLSTAGNLQLAILRFFISILLKSFPCCGFRLSLGWLGEWGVVILRDSLSAQVSYIDSLAFPYTGNVVKTELLNWEFTVLCWLSVWSRRLQFYIQDGERSERNRYVGGMFRFLLTFVMNAYTL